MGMKIAMTGLVVFCFFLFVGGLAKKEPRQDGLLRTAGLIMLVGLLAIPAGLIISIWE